MYGGNVRPSARMVDAVVKYLRGATLMQDGEYHHARRLRPKINSVGKAADESSPQLPMNQGVSFGASISPINATPAQVPDPRTIAPRQGYQPAPPAGRSRKAKGVSALECCYRPECPGLSTHSAHPPRRRQREFGAHEPDLILSGYREYNCAVAHFAAMPPRACPARL
jgi:hypothetical protein